MWGNKPDFIRVINKLDAIKRIQLIMIRRITFLMALALFLNQPLVFGQSKKASRFKNSFEIYFTPSLT